MSYYEDITVSAANVIRFRHTDGLAASFDNTLTDDESFSGIRTRTFKQKFISDDPIPIQLKLSGAGTSATEVVLTKYRNGYNPAVLTPTATTVYADFTIYEYLIAPKTGECIYLVASTDSDSWTSETIEAFDSLDDHLKIEWFNYEVLTANENWHFDYQTPQAQAHANMLRLNALLFEYSPSGEKSILDNQNEKMILKRSLFRRLKLETAPIPRWLAEKLIIAMSHDVFVVNDIAFVCEEDPEVERSGKTNFVTLTAVLTQKDVLGINTHDIGFDVDSTAMTGIINMTETGSGAKVFTITDDYMILTLTGIRTAGSPIITAGTTVGGSDILAGMSLSAGYITEVASLAVDKGSLVDGNLYVTISGGGATATVHVLTIKNRQ